MSDQTPPQGPDDPGKLSEEPLGGDLPEALRPADLTQPTGGMSAPEPPPPVDPSATRAIGSEPPAMPPPSSQPPPQGIYNPPPQQGGYMPPQQGGYVPPQQGGQMPPPQGGGYGAPPPPQGGYPPPQQGGYPPPQGGGYGAPPPPPGYGYGAPPPPPPPPRPAGFMGLLQAWLNAAIKPNVRTYEAEISHASWSSVLFGIGAVAITGFIVGLISSAAAATQIDSAIAQMQTIDQPGIEIFIRFLEWLKTILPFFAFISLIIPFATFFLGAGFQYMAAKMVGQSEGGDFLQMSYLASLSYASLGSLRNLLNIIPGLGDVLAFIVSLYQIYCVGISMQTSQKMPSGKAQMSAFSPFIVCILLVCLCCAGSFVLSAMSIGASR